jgi:3-phosphoshikimate 1-carboxyvinyltransferase
MNVTILPARNAYLVTSGKDFSLPPDKSIFHRILFIGSLSGSQIIIPIASQAIISEDIEATMGALTSLGVAIRLNEDKIELQGVGLHGLRKPLKPIDSRNSGTTARLLMGILAGQDFDSVLMGDESLSKRPMKRLADLLIEMGAEIEFPNGDGLPALIHGKKLQGKGITLPIASAQIKSALLLAGLYVEGTICVTERTPTRDHTERMLNALGVGGSDLPKVFTYNLPGDISSAAFLISAAILSRLNITLRNVGLNATRRRFLDILIDRGLHVSVTESINKFGELRATLEIEGSSFSGFKGYDFTAEDIALSIDEIAALAVVAAFYDGETIFRNAGELRKKESDRIRSITSNLASAGIEVMEYEDGFSVNGKTDRKIGKCEFDSYGDHRIAMAFSVLATRASEPVTIRNAEVVSISFPNFFDALGLMIGTERIERE